MNYHNLLFSSIPINSIVGFIIRTYKKVGYGVSGKPKGPSAPKVGLEVPNILHEWFSGT